MTVVSMGPKAERLCVLDGAAYDFHQTCGLDRAHRLGTFHPIDQLSEIMGRPRFPESVFHTQTVNIYEKNGEDELIFRLSPRDRQRTDPITPDPCPANGLDDRPSPGFG